MSKLIKRPYKIEGLNVHIVSEENHEPECDHFLGMEGISHIFASIYRKEPNRIYMDTVFTFCPLCGKRLV
jgi:hypothetical protein